MLSIVTRQLPPYGITYGPQGTGPFPAIMVLHGSEGGYSGWSHCVSMLFAAHGYLAFPYAYSLGGNIWNAGSIVDIPIDNTVNALTALQQCDFACEKVGVYGVSRGGEHAMLLTSLMAAENCSGLPDALAVHGPPDVVCGAFDAKTYRDSGDPGWKAWDPADRAWSWRGTSDNLKPTTPIEIERYNGPIFLSHGSLDSVWTVEMTQRLEERLKGREPHLEVHYYANADHVCYGETENTHNEHLLNFFDSFLKV